MHINALPAETLLQILGYLPIQSICTLESVSRAFHKLINGNLNAIYLVAARLHQFAPQIAAPCKPQTALKIAVASLGPSKSLRDIRNWKQFCKASFLLEQSWLSLPPLEDQPVHRRMKVLAASHIQTGGDFKVDGIERTVITSTAKGAIEVVSIETGEQLWSLQEGPHRGTMTARPMEFEEGFLIISELGSNIIDVWRRSADCYHPRSYLPSRPTETQLTRSPDAATAFSFGYLPIDGSSNEPTSPLTTCSLQTTAELPRQGVFLPFAQIEYQCQFIRPRYTHPYLAILRESFPKEDLSVVDIWHLPTLQRLARLRVDRDVGYVVDIAIGPTYLYVAASHRIVAYKWTSAISAESGEPVFLQAYPQFVMPQAHANQFPTFLCQRIDQAYPQSSGTYIADPDNIVLFTPFAPPTDLQQIDLQPEGDWTSASRFTGIAISPDGSDLVAIVKFRWAVYIANFPSRGSASSRSKSNDGQNTFLFGIGQKSEEIPQFKKFSNITEIIDHVAFDGNRVLLRTREGVFAAVVKDRRYVEPAYQLEPNTSPHLKPPFTICGVERPHFGWKHPGACLNLLNGSAWFTTPSLEPERRFSYRDHICYIDFSDLDEVEVSAGASYSGTSEDEASV